MDVAQCATSGRTDVKFRGLYGADNYYYIECYLSPKSKHRQTNSQRIDICAVSCIVFTVHSTEERHSQSAVCTFPIVAVFLFRAQGTVHIS